MGKRSWKGFAREADVDLFNTMKAISYVQTRGDPVAHARLVSILWNKAPRHSILDKLSKMQNPDGGFSYWVKGFSTICDTVQILTWLDDLSLRRGDLVEAATDFLLVNQKEDGGWDEVEKMKDANPPPFLVPGELNTRVWLTAYCAHWLMRHGYAESPKSKGCPAKFLLANRESSGRLVGYLRATWDALVMFSYYPGKDSEEFRQTLKAIEKEFAPDKWEGSYIAWLLCCLRDAQIPRHHSVTARCIDQLVRKQRPDGSWESEDGDEYAVNATIEALRALKHYEAVSIPQI